MQQMRTWIDAPSRIIEWKGLSFCQDLAADFGYVVDYYLHGGESRLRAAVADVSKLLGVDLALREKATDTPTRAGQGSAALLEPGEVHEHLLRLDRVLDTDPHFRYGYSLDLHRPDLTPEPRLVAATQQTIAKGRWLTFKIYARSAQSLDQRPIPLKLTFSFEDDPAGREAFELWLKYGKPAVVGASFEADFPGGLSGGGKDGRVTLSPAEGETTEFRNRLRIVDGDRIVLAELAFAMSSTTGLDRTGSWARGVDDSGILTTESLIDATAMGGNISWKIQPLEGREAVKVLGAVIFASQLTAPNLLQVAGEYGAFVDFTPIGLPEPLVKPPYARFVHALATIQSATGRPVVIPDVDTLSSDEFSAIARAASLISGHTHVGTWRPLTVENTSAEALTPGGHYQFAILEPLVVKLNGEDLVLGCVAKQTLSATVESIDDDRIRIVPHLNNAVHFNFVTEMPSLPPGRQAVRFRPAPAPNDTPEQD